jgi:hypothetical protein
MSLARAPVLSCSVAVADDGLAVDGQQPVVVGQCHGPLGRSVGALEKCSRLKLFDLAGAHGAIPRRFRGWVGSKAS